MKSLIEPPVIFRFILDKIFIKTQSKLGLDIYIYIFNEKLYEQRTL